MLIRFTITAPLKAALYAVILSFSVLVSAHVSQAEVFRVHVDQAKLMPLKKASTAVIIGNPSIADVSVQSSKLLVITGKSFGTTNVIVLDSRREVITSAVINVSNDSRQVVSLYKGSFKQSYYCAEKCDSIVSPGDEDTYFKNNQSATASKFGLVTNGGATEQSGQ